MKQASVPMGDVGNRGDGHDCGCCPDSGGGLRSGDGTGIEFGALGELVDRDCDGVLGHCHPGAVSKEPHRVAVHDHGSTDRPLPTGHWICGCLSAAGNMQSRLPGDCRCPLVPFDHDRDRRALPALSRGTVAHRVETSSVRLAGGGRIARCGVDPFRPGRLPPRGARSIHGRSLGPRSSEAPWAWW